MLDQFSKKLIAAKLTLHESIPVLDHFFTIIYVHNKGFIFGILNRSNSSFFTIIISMLSIASLLLIASYFFWGKGESRLFMYGFSFVIGGALGNMLDRVREGYVIDFLDFYAGNYHWPTFNFADTFICIGVFLLLLDILTSKSKKAH
jgi:signal peptidase II